MKAILQTIVWLCNALLAIVFFLSCFTQFIPSSIFSYAVFFALLFPYLFLLIFCFAIINLFFSKKWSLLFFLILIPGLYNFFHVVAISPNSKWQMKKDTDAIRIMTWNVSSFVSPAPLVLPEAIERKQILETISEYNPDIICIQEYYNAYNSRDLPSEKHELDSIGYHYLLFSRDDQEKTFYGEIERGTAIASKTPFLDSGRMQIREDVHNEFFIFGDVKLQNKIVRINSAHLASYFLFPDSAQGYVGKRRVAKKMFIYKNHVQERLREVEVLHDVQAAKIRHVLDTSSYPNIYCGDMNATSCMYSYRLLKGASQDAFLQKGNGIGATFYNIAPTLRIDMCFPDKHFIVQQCTVVHRKLGDHYPVVTDLKWKEP